MPDGVREQANRDDLKAKIDALPPALAREVEDFVEFVVAKHSLSAEQAELGFSEPEQHTFAVTGAEAAGEGEQERAFAQARQWEKLAGRWKSERSSGREIRDIYAARSQGREVTL